MTGMELRRQEALACLDGRAKWTKRASAWCRLALWMADPCHPLRAVLMTFEAPAKKGGVK